MKNSVAQVVFDLPVEGPFDYDIPQALQPSIQVGHRVLAPFHVKTLIGYVVALKDESAFPQLKSILKVLDQNPVVSTAMLQYAKDFSQEYYCSLGEAIATFLPSNFKKRKKGIDFSVGISQRNDAPARTMVIRDESLCSFWPAVSEPIAAAIEKNQQVMIVVPENDRIPELAQQVQKRFARPLAIFDKEASSKDQERDWIAIQEGKCCFILGSRSAIFAPAQRLGLIIMLEENNFSYKQDQTPFYHARQAVLLRARSENISLIFVNRFVSVQLQHIIQKEKIAVTQIRSRAHAPTKQLIDLSNYKYRKNQAISIPLQCAIERTLAQKGKVLLVMNKKGFGSFGSCAKCQHVLKCPRCDVPLTFLYQEQKIVCRHCQYKADRPSACPQCQGAYVNFSGMGIEKLESEVSRLFPSAKVQCYSNDTDKPSEHCDIIIATQIFTRLYGMTFQLSCAMDVDSELNRLDFQAAEKTFALLTDLEAMTQDTLYVQARLKDNDCLKTFLKNKIKDFYKQELALRRELQFPPFVHLAQIVTRSTNSQAAFQRSQRLYEEFMKKSGKKFSFAESQVLSLARLRDQYRFAIVAKSRSRSHLMRFIRTTLKHVKKAGPTTTVVNMEP